MKVGIFGFILGVFVSGLAGAQTRSDPNNPEAFLKDTLAAIVRVLEEKELDLTTKENRINLLVQPIFDFQLMSGLTLGRTQWSKMTKLQRRQFVDLFVLRLKESYRDKLSMYSGEKILYKPPVRKGTKIQIPTELVTQEQNVTILYKMYETRKQGWKIYDVEVEGVSLVTTYRVQFKEVLSKGSIEDLLQKLKQPEPEKVPAQP